MISASLCAHVAPEGLYFLWPHCIADATLCFCPVVSFIFFSSPNLSGRSLHIYHTSTHGVALVQKCKCRMHVWNLLHTARWKYRMQKWRQKSPSGHHHTTLSGYIFTTKARIDNRKKNLLSSNISSTCPLNMVNFGLLAAEIVSLVWVPLQISMGFASWQRYCTHSGIGHQPNFAALNRRRHLYSAGWPSRWALAHISSFLHA